MKTNEQASIADSEPITASTSGVEDSSAPGQSGTPDETRKPAARAKGGQHTALKPTEASSLNAAEREDLISCEKDIKNARATGRAAFFRMVEALARIHKSKLYRETHRSFEAYAAEKWGLGRSHANRFASAGEIILRQKLSPRGDICLLMDSEAHYRSLAMLETESQDMVLDLLGTWRLWDKELQITPRTVQSAIEFLNPPAGANDIGQRENPLFAKFQAAVDEVIKQLPENIDDEIRGCFEQLKKKVAALEDPAATGEGELPDAPWNLLQDCGKNSSSLLPENLVAPLRDRTQRPYVVNSMSDLFHDKVPDTFIETVFDVMVKAQWHTFQILTKRPERMAEFTAKYFAGKQPPANIWLGASAENQKALGERLPHLLKVVTAVRWLSCEPLIGPIEFDSLNGIHWVVAGGESGKGARKMELPWATSIRDACKKADVAFFFKQWGLYGEDGTKVKKMRKDGLTPPPLEGKIHNAYPQARSVAPRKTQPKPQHQKHS